MTLAIDKSTEIAIRRLISSGLSDRAIAREVDSCDFTVSHIRRACETVDGMPPEMRTRVRLLVSAGRSRKEIALSLGIPAESVADVIRFDRFAQADPPKRCSECGSMILPPMDSKLPERRKADRFRGDVSRNAAHGLCDVAQDVIHLRDLCLITHPLFYTLAQRAERCLAKVYGKEEANDR